MGVNGGSVTKVDTTGNDAPYVPYWFRFHGRRAPAPSVLRILERAIEVIDANGEVAIRTNIIATECGVTPPILYRAFGSREGLVIAAQAERYHRSNIGANLNFSRLVGGAANQAEFWARMSDYLAFVLDDSRTYLRQLRATVIGSAASRPELARIIHAIDADTADHFAGVMEPARVAGWIEPKGDLGLVTRLGLGIVFWRISVETSLPPDQVEQWDSLAVDAIMRSVFGDRIHDSLHDDGALRPRSSARQRKRDDR